MSNPKVSIIISTYNRKDRVCNAVDSVLNQTYPDFELIVVDDYSSDFTYEKLLKEYGDNPKVTVLRLEENSGGPARPRNEGILLSKGEYIGFLDDDNTYRPDHLAVLVTELDNNKKVDLVYGDRFCIYEEDPERNGIGVYYDHNSAVLMQRNYIDTSDFLVRREALFEIGGWDEGHRRMLDWNLVARLDKAGKTLVHVPKIITDYLIHKDGMLSDDQNVSNEWYVMKYPGEVKIASAIDCDIVLPYLKEQHDPKVAIFTIVWNRKEYTKQSFESLWKTAGYEFDHYIVDNGSTDGAADYLKEYQKEHKDRVHLLFNEDNKGIAIASNQLLKEIRDSGIKYDIIGKFDNDAMCQTDNWLKTMVGIYKCNHRLAMSCYISGLKDNAGGVPRYVYGKIKNELVGMTKHLGGICCFTNADIRLSFVLDETETLHTFDDLMFSKYIQERGYQMCYLENYYISHGPRGTEEIYKDYPEYYKKLMENKTKSYAKTNR